MTRKNDVMPKQIGDRCPWHKNCGVSDTSIVRRETNMSITTILLIVLVLILIGALPTWPYSSGWGYTPSGILGAIVVVMLVLLLLGRI
jgi:Protein of unknown function (DUF3309)